MCGHLEESMCGRLEGDVCTHLDASTNEFRCIPHLQSGAHVPDGEGEGGL